MVLKADGVRMAAVSEALLEDVVDPVQTTSMHLKTLDDVVADAEKAMGLTEYFDPASRYTCDARARCVSNMSQVILIKSLMACISG